MTTARTLVLTACSFGLCVQASGVLAETAATVLFSQEGARILSAAGVARPARQGELVQAGEVLLTPVNAISQLRLPDGSLVGVRSGSELKFDVVSPAVNSGSRSLALMQGTIRVIGADLMDRQKTSSLSLQSGPATLQLKGADLESTVIRGDSGITQGRGQPGEPGSYNRLLAGAGSLRSGAVVEPLAMRQVSFAAAGNSVPMPLASMPGPAFREGGPSGPPPGAGAPATLAPAPGGPMVLSPMMSSLSTRGIRPELAPMGAVSGAALPAGAPPMFSPITTKMFPGAGPNPPPGLLPGPMAGRPMANPGLPINIRPPIICSPNPIAGKPPICK